MAIYNGPARGGTRGGKDQFNWEDVKEDRQSQNYLDDGVKAARGRWQKGKDLTWYAKGSQGKAADLRQAARDEIAAAKARDMDLMAQMLGEKPMEGPKSKLDRTEKNKLFKKGGAEEGTVAEGIEGEGFGERIQGLGFAPIKVDDLREQMLETVAEKIEGTGVNMNELLAKHAAGGADDHPHHGGGGGGDADHAAMLAAIMGSGGFGGGGGGSDDEGESRADKKARKAEKKAKKAEKKARKAEKKASKKEAKGSKRKDSSSSSSPEPQEPRREGASSFFAKEHSKAERSRSRSRERMNKARSDIQSRNGGYERGGGGGYRERSRESFRDRDREGRERDVDRSRGRDRDKDR